MSYARNPARMMEHSKHASHARRVARTRHKTLTEVRELLQQAPDVATALRVIEEELNEIK
jgi:hypothetical protein